MEISDTIFPMILSRFQADAILRAHKDGKSAVRISPDLGLTTIEAALCHEGVVFPGGQSLSLQNLAAISAHENACFRLDRNGVEPVRIFSEESGRTYSLVPTSSAPALMICGFLMHRIKGTDPWRAAAGMVEALAPLKGRILDTATGLGYTAIKAAALGAQVTTIEIDPNIRELAWMNPWSRPLFDNPKISLVSGDCTHEIETFATESLNAILHDPPAFDVAGELYSAAFYRQAWRVLSRNGKMFHYIGDPSSKSVKKVTTGVVRRMKDAGFRRVVPRPDAFGIVALK